MALHAAIAAGIAAAFGAPCRPRRVLMVDDLPRTRIQKLMLRLIRAAVSSEELPPLDALANPECLGALHSAALETQPAS